MTVELVYGPYRMINCFPVCPGPATLICNHTCLCSRPVDCKACLNCFWEQCLHGRARAIN